MYIREAKNSDFNDILLIERAAFNSNEEAELVRNILADPSAKPLLSLIAFLDGHPAGHILFSKAQLSNNPQVKVSILAPLAVIPDCQKQGIGGALVKRGLLLSEKAGVGLVFVAGHPNYYPQYGFTPAGKLGFEPPYPIPEKDADAWMVQELRPNIIKFASGKVVCCDALKKPEYWRE